MHRVGPSTMDHPKSSSSADRHYTFDQQASDSIHVDHYLEGEGVLIVEDRLFLKKNN
jgi:hypothetical protein